MEEKIQMILFKLSQWTKQAEEDMRDPIMSQFNKGKLTAYNKVIELIEKEMEQ